MKIKAGILFFLLFSTVPLAFAQSEKEPQLVDEFTYINCDDLLARIDNFFIQLLNSPETKGVFSITGRASELGKMLRMEQMLRAAAFQRRHQSERVEILRSSSSEPTKVQFLLAANNGAFPASGINRLPAKLPPYFNPLNIRNDMSQICDPEPIEPTANELLSANPEGQIYVVVNYASPRERVQQLNEATRMLKIYPRSRVRYLLRKYDSGWNDYWFVYGRPPISSFYKRLRIEQAWSY